MKISKIWLFILVFPLLLSFTFAGPINFESYLETVDIESKDNVHETIEIIMNVNESQNFINFSLNPRVKSLIVSLDDQEIECTIEEIVGSSIINCQLPDYLTGKHFFKIEFDSLYPLILLNNGRLMFRSS